MCFYCSCLSQSFKFDCRFSGVYPRYSFGEDLYGVNETSLNTRWFNWWPTFIPNRLEATNKLWKGHIFTISKKVTSWIALYTAISILNPWRFLRRPLLFQYFSMAPVQAISFLLKKTTVVFFDASTTRIFVTRKDMRDICVQTLWTSVLLGNLPHYYCVVFFFWLPFGRILQMFVSWFLGGTRPFFFSQEPAQILT